MAKAKKRKHARPVADAAMRSERPKHAWNTRLLRRALYHGSDAVIVATLVLAGLLFARVITSVALMLLPLSLAGLVACLYVTGMGVIVVCLRLRLLATKAYFRRKAAYLRKRHERAMDIELSKLSRNVDAELRDLTEEPK